jgi:hypothetical protein
MHGTVTRWALGLSISIYWRRDVVCKYVDEGRHAWNRDALDANMQTDILTLGG